jgi:hypothetical protein
LAIASNLDIIVLHVLQHPPVEREIGLETMDFPINYRAFICKKKNNPFWDSSIKSFEPIFRSLVRISAE